jgi:hypothetical protein
MPTIHVVKAFIYQTPDERKQQFNPGIYDVPDDTANHWFVQAHLAGYVTPPRQTAPSYQQMELEVMQAVRRNEPVATQVASAQPPPQANAEVMTPTGDLPAPNPDDMRGWVDMSERKMHTFAGKPAEALDGPTISLLPSSAP